MSRVPFAAILALGLIVLSIGCGGRIPASDPFDGSAGTLIIEVQNQNFLDATIYAIAPGIRRRLGTVTGKADGEFRMAWNFANPLRLTIDLLAGASCTTNQLLVGPGEVVQLVVESDLERDPDCR